MDVFINEYSLHEQLVEHDKFADAIGGFFSVLNILRSKNPEYQLYQRSDMLYVYRAVKGEEFNVSLSTLRDKSLKIAVFNLFNKLNPHDWIQEQIHSSDDIFTYNGEIVTDTSMAELAERFEYKMLDIGLLVNFPESKLQNLTSVTVIKNDEVSTDLACVDNKKDFANWLEDNFHISRFEYDPNSHTPPLDSQTILRDKKRFERTRLPSQGGRTLYRERNSGHLWYVDNFHFGAAAHLEVFNSVGLHVGEADLLGNVDELKRDQNKRIGV